MVTIDAQNKKLGRLASEVALLLRGKNSVAFSPNLYPKQEVKIINASKMSVAPEKMEGKTYTHHSEYPGGFKRETLKKIITKKGYGEALRRAIRGMLPANKLRARMLTHLVIEE
jgi:large subunit ribosomal protein L13